MIILEINSTETWDDSRTQGEGRNEWMGGLTSVDLKSAAEPE